MRKKYLNLTVLMSSKFNFSMGKKIHVKKIGDLYYAASNGHIFGIIKEIKQGSVEQLHSLGTEFYGLVTAVNEESHTMNIRVKI